MRVYTLTSLQATLNNRPSNVAGQPPGPGTSGRLWVCDDCGGLVYAKAQHDQFHERIDDTRALAISQ